MMNFPVTILVWLILSSSLMLACGQTPAENAGEDAKLIQVTELPDEVLESSGIIFFDSLVWTHNDSGHEPILYGIHPETGEIEREIFLRNASNIDWEDITQDEHAIYIGDFGNRNGTRDDLRIYILDKDSLTSSPKQTVSVTYIEYKYSDQYSFSSEPNQSPYDCEALFAARDSLFLLTKDWADETSVLYRLPAKTGFYIAERINELDDYGLITGADYDPENNRLAVCGYKQYIPFVVVFTIEHFHNLAKTEAEPVYFYENFGLQVEGIAVSDKIYLSCEQSVEVQSLYYVEF